MREFTPEALQRLVRNPLGIIALFLLLVYGIAGLVFGASASSLVAAERAPLIWFLVIFPVLVLALFAWLVARHHTKLYAPFDFPTRDGFFRAMSPTERKERVDQEVVAVKEELKSATPPSESASAVTSQTEPIRPRVVLAEELALREIETEFGRPVARGVKAGDRAYDGAFRLPDREVAVEVRYTQRPNWLSIASRALEIAASFRGTGRAFPVTLLLAVVCDQLTQEERARGREVLAKRLEGAGPYVKLRLFDFDELRAKYGLIDQRGVA